MNVKNFDELKQVGYTIIQNLVSEEWIEKLSTAINKEFTNHRLKQIQNNNDIKTDGVALHVLLSDDLFIEFLQYLIDTNFIVKLKENYFKSNCIINSFSALNNLPSNPNFSAKVHRDLRFYTHGLPVMVNCLLMIDDFTESNGGTLLLPYSHLIEKKPTQTEFEDNCVQIVGKKGDMLVFESNVWHASAPNHTQDGRRAIPITISRSFLKQLLDYPRAIGYERQQEFSLELQQLLGYHSRVPANLDEWYQPEENRFYKKDQD
jgi:ectoine hydroxylase-related dioxygenase (phytanoyl-CoA dioxygenase family)